jgi:hypothetical protein
LNAAYAAQGDFVPAYLSAGLAPGCDPINGCGHSKITAYMPFGDSVYHGWGTSLSRRFSNGLQFVGSYTWSHAIDNSTADVFSTYSTPRRAQNSQDFRAERASSALDHRNRFSFELLYEMRIFNHSNWLLKNIVGNWEIAPIYTYQTGSLYTVQSGVDSNMNGDSAPDRAIVNPSGGNPDIGSGTSALTNCAGQTVAYLVDNPAATYVAAPKGALATAGRNTKKLNPIDDIDVTVAKRFTIGENKDIKFSARVFNIFNHPQYIGGYLNDVSPIGATDTNQLQFYEPDSPLFGQISQVWSSNPRTMVLSLKVSF